MKNYVWHVFFFVAAIYFLLSLAGCVSVTKPLPDATPKPVVAELPWGHPEWTAHLLSELNASTLPDRMPSDLIKLCPKYDKLSRPERRDVWAHLIVAMAKRESGWKPETKYVENFKGSDGKYIVSRGLLQLSQSSANGYGCEISPAEELHDPLVNLSCAVRIIDRWVGRDGVAMGSPGKNTGCGRYWSVCRASSGSYTKVQALVASAPGCH